MLHSFVFTHHYAAQRTLKVQRTIYNTPIISQLFKLISWTCLKLRGWKLVGELPKEKKYVIIAVPHTSNWDFPLTLALAFVFGFKLYWMGKDSLFKGAYGPIMRWLGGISIDRSKSNNLVQQMIEAFDSYDELTVTVPPEGTRSKVDKWKTGFYYIAQGANVPIAMAFLDYENKKGGFIGTFYPTGDIDKDIAEIRQQYKGITGRFANQSHVDD